MFRHQLAAFVISGAFCGLAGALFVVYDQSANPDLLNWTESGYPILMAVLGGQFTFLGPALGALIYEQARDVLLVNFTDSQLVFGLVLLVIMLAAPDGVAGLLGRGGRCWRAGGAPSPRRGWAAAAATRPPAPPANRTGERRWPAVSTATNAVAATAAATEPLLDIHGLTKVFGGFTAVAGVDLAVRPGTIHSVIGPNGAGKTTLFRVVTGVHRPTSGTVRFDGHNITGARPHVVSRRGLTQSFQITNVFPRLTVLESVQVARPGAASPERGPGLRALAPGGGRGGRTARRGRPGGRGRRADPDALARRPAHPGGHPGPGIRVPGCYCSTSPPRGCPRPKPAGWSTW